MTQKANGKYTLSVPYMDKDNTVNGEKCLRPDETGILNAEPCDDGSLMQEWELKSTYPWAFQMTNTGNGKCAKQLVWTDGSLVQTVECNEKDSGQNWSYFA